MKGRWDKGKRGIEVKKVSRRIEYKRRPLRSGLSIKKEMMAGM